MHIRSNGWTHKHNDHEVGVTTKLRIRTDWNKNTHCYGGHRKHSYYQMSLWYDQLIPS